MNFKCSSSAAALNLEQHKSIQPLVNFATELISSLGGKINAVYPINCGNSSLSNHPLSSYIYSGRKRSIKKKKERKKKELLNNDRAHGQLGTKRLVYSCATAAQPFRFSERKKKPKRKPRLSSASARVALSLSLSLSVQKRYIHIEVEKKEKTAGMLEKVFLPCFFYSRGKKSSSSASNTVGRRAAAAARQIAKWPRNRGTVGAFMIRRCPMRRITQVALKLPLMNARVRERERYSRED